LPPYKTHIPRNINIAKNGYKIYTSAATPHPKQGTEKGTPGKHISGIAIAIHEELDQHVCMVNRINESIMTITLDREQTHTPIAIIATYAPHQGYNNHEKNKHWEQVGKMLQEIPRKHMKIWGADANGQLGRDTTRPEQYNKIIGPFTKQATPGKGNGVKLAQQCIKHQMIPMNT